MRVLGEKHQESEKENTSEREKSFQDRDKKREYRTQNQNT